MSGRVPAIDAEAVEALLRCAAYTAILPRFQALRAAEVHRKGVDDVVTDADLEAESIITSGLVALAAGIPVIGEEAVAANPALARGLESLATYWVLDPVDGTANFVAGSPDFGVMLALVHGGEVVQSWILLPVPGTLVVAERGAGAWIDGSRISHAPRDVLPARDLVGMASTRFLPPERRAVIEPHLARFAEVSAGPNAAAVAYVDLARARVDFGLQWRTWPWDHAPGSLILRESGGAARRLDGADYQPGDTRSGLITTAYADDWDAVRAGLLDD